MGEYYQVDIHLINGKTISYDPRQEENKYAERAINSFLGGGPKGPTPSVTVHEYETDIKTTVVLDTVTHFSYQEN